MRAFAARHVLLLLCMFAQPGCAERTANVASHPQIEEQLGLRPPDAAALRSGMELHFGFHNAAALAAFVAMRDSSAAVAPALWGAALTLGPTLNSPMGPGQNDAALRVLGHPALAGIDPGSLLGRLTAALRLRYAGRSPATEGYCDSLYATEMLAIASSYPSSDLYALAAEGLMIAHRWDYWNPDGTPKIWSRHIDDTLEQSLTLDSLHIGANHLFIHLWEGSGTPERALPSALRLERMPLSIGHLIHMPAHIFMQLGWYDRAISCNVRAIAADSTSLSRAPCHSLYSTGYYPHNYHFLAASATMAGQRALAVKAALELRARTDSLAMVGRGQARLQHVWAYHLLVWTRFSDWDAILAQSPPPMSAGHAYAIWAYARGCALVAVGRSEEAVAHAGSIESAHGSKWADEDLIWYGVTPSDVLGVAGAVLRARIAAHQGRVEEALKLYETAARLQDRLAYDEPPDWYYPIRESIGGLQLRMNRHARAEEEFRESLRRAPASQVAMKGLARSLRAQGRDAQASEAEAQVDSLRRHADGGPERFDSSSF